MPQAPSNSEFPFPSIAMPFGRRPTPRVTVLHLARMILWVVTFIVATVVDMRLHRLFWTWIALLTTIAVWLANFAYSFLRVRARMKHLVTNPSLSAMVERLSQATVKEPGTVEFADGQEVVFTPTVLTFRDGQKKITRRAQEFALKGGPKKPTFILHFDCWDPPLAGEPLSPIERNEAVQFINAAFSKLVARRPWRKAALTAE